MIDEQFPCSNLCNSTIYSENSSKIRKLTGLRTIFSAWIIR